MNSADEVWHVLQLSDALDLEFASALSEFVPVILWEPARRLYSQNGFQVTERVQADTGLRIRTFPLVRGYARFPISALAGTGPDLAGRLSEQVSSPHRSVLVCTTPFFAPVAERWPGPVVYWLSDLIAMYGRSVFERVRKLDQRMCRRATLVCPNSVRIAEYLRCKASCAADRCEVLPNATGTRSLLAAPLTGALPLPEAYAHLPRPIAGVIGNLAENTDWVFLQEVIRRTPWLFWLFVGPAEGRIRDRGQRGAREWVMRSDQTCFIGAQPYTELYRFARGIDVAVLPYRLREPTFSGSSTRFYDHLAAGHPILATSAVFALRNKEPLLKLVDTAEDAAFALEGLRAAGFQDSLRQARWEASLKHTWRDRAQSMQEMLHRRWKLG